MLIEGLRRLEYRGYDSAGVAVLNGGSEVARLRTLALERGWRILDLFDKQ